MWDDATMFYVFDSDVTDVEHIDNYRWPSPTEIVLQTRHRYVAEIAVKALKSDLYFRRNKLIREWRTFNARWKWRRSLINACNLLTAFRYK